MQDHKAAFGCRLGKADDVGVRHGTGGHQLLLPQGLHRLQPVPQLCGLLKFQLLRGLQHLCPQLLGQLLVVPGEQQPGLLHGSPVVRRAPAQLAPALALVHVVIQAGPVLPQVPGKLLAAVRQLQGPENGVQHMLSHAPAAIWPKISRTIVSQLVDHGDSGVLLRHVQPQVGVALVILQKDVIFGQIPLNQGAFQNQGLKLRRRHNHVKVVDL